MSAIERILNNILQEATAVKFIPLKNACKEALDLLESYNCPAPTHELRQKCLNCIKIALESRRTRFQAHGVNALQKLITDDRFHSGIEPENQEQWLASQVLHAVKGTATFHENTQVEIMKVLLQLTLSHFWCASTDTIIKIAEVYLDTYITTTQASIKAAIRATLTQMLSNLSEKVSESQRGDSDDSDQEAENIISDFVGKDVENNSCDSMTDDVVLILNFLCDKLSSTQSVTARKPLIPLLLEGIHSVLTHLPMSVKNNPLFIELLWKRLCPSLIAILGNPMQDKTVRQKPNVPGETETSGRGSGCSSSAPSLNTGSMNVLYNIVIELVKFVGGLRSLRPVLESVFYRMMLYPPPQHRLEALKMVKEVLSSPEGVLSFAGPTVDDDQHSTHPADPTKLPQSNTALLKIVIDSLQECVHCNDVSVCIASVQCMDELLKSVEQICNGDYLSDENIEGILDQFRDCELPKLSPKHQARLSPRHQFFTSQEIEDDTLNIEIRSDEENSNDSTVKINGSPVKISLSAKVCDTDSPTDSIEFGLLNKTNESQGEDETDKEAVSESFEQMERQRAREYITCLSQLLPSLLDVLCANELDESIQTFASNFCAGQLVAQKGEGKSCVSILNADGVYLTTYNVLLLNLKLANLDFYRHKDIACPVTQDGFLHDILDGELLLHLTDSWLREVYDLITKTNLLQVAGFNEHTHKHTVLYSTLVDIDGLESKQVDGQLMKSYREEMEVETDVKKKRANEAGMKFARYVLALCWDGVLDVLSVLLNGKSACGLKSSVQLMLGLEGAKEENHRAREAMCTSLEGLQRAATMSCLLGLHQRCATVFDQLAQASCVIEDYQHLSPQVERRNKVVEVLTHKPKLPRLHAAHTMSLDVVLNTGLEIGSHARDCWRHVFRCCAHVNHLEHLYFSRSSGIGPKTLKQDTQVEGTHEEDEFGSEIYSASFTVPTVSLAPTVSVAELIKESQKESGWDMGMKGVLNTDKTSKAICSLSQAVDRLFEDSSDKLTMKALIEFLSELCQSSKLQLQQLARSHSKDESTSILPTNVLLIYRLGDVMLRTIRSDRPLMHIMRAWTVAAPHLIESACHRDHRISKKAITCLHEVITTLLSNHRELPHFHFNELLCKPFENLICMELCDGDVQDQIVCSICELVEACTTEIRSGWRPLFASLRAVKIEFTASEEVNEARQRHVAAVLDVFDVFLNSDNALVFSNAAVDCILCLLKYVRGPGAFEADEDDSDDEYDPNFESNSESLCIPALQYLKQCCNILAKMWRMPACPVVTGAHRIRLLARPKMVDPMIPIIELNEYERTFSPENSPVRKSRKKTEESNQDQEEKTEEVDEEPEGTICEEGESKPNAATAKSSVLESENRTKSPIPDSLRLSPEVEAAASKMPNTDIAKFKAKNEGLHSSISLELTPQSLAEIDNHTGILHVWFLLLDGMAHAVSASPKTFQPQTVDTLFQLLRNIADDPGPVFGIHCINHLLLPMLQEWMRRSTREYGYWRGQMNNFKQCMGLAADLIVEYVIRFVDCSENGHRVELLLKQLLDILVECISQPIESISRLGCSCFRHALLTAGPVFTESLWNIATQSLLHAFRVSTYSLQQLMMLFSPYSTSFSGDLGGVKVAARKDCTTADTERLSHLALQVFLLDCQRKVGVTHVSEVEGDRSYIFLLYPAEYADSINPDHITARVPFRSMVVGLLSHQLLLQTVGAVLLGNDNYEFTRKIEGKLPGMLSELSGRCILALLQCLQESYHVACQFDTRPGLKFLIQKVARSDVAANLYRQAGISMTFLITCLFELVANQKHDIDFVKDILGRHIDRMTSVTDSVKPFDISNNHRDMALARSSHDAYTLHYDVYAKLLFEICCEVCSTYVDLVSEKELTALADRMSHQSLFFLVAQPDDLEIKKDKSFLAKFSDKNKDKVVIEGINCSTVAVQDQPDSVPYVQDEAYCRDSDVHEHKAQTPDDKVYNVASDQTIRKLMNEYKRRKLQHAMPTFQKPKRRSSSSSSLSERDALIEKEQNESIFKDAEAHVQSWTELTCTMLTLLRDFSDERFALLLPVVFPSVNQLIRHAEDVKLKKALSDWLMRLGELYQITAKAKVPKEAS